MKRATTFEVHHYKGRRDDDQYDVDRNGRLIAAADSESAALAAAKRRAEEGDVLEVTDAKGYPEARYVFEGGRWKARRR